MTELPLTCTWKPEHDMVRDVPVGPECGEPATHVILWLDGSNRWSPGCDAHLELEDDAPVHMVVRVGPLQACGHCGFVASGFPEEIAHMTTWHPEVVAERLNKIGENITAEQIRATAGPDFPPRG